MTSPEVGSASRIISFRKVLFPAPDSPTIKTNSPFSIRRLTSLSACTPLSYTLCTPLNSIKEIPPSKAQRPLSRKRTPGPPGSRRAYRPRSVPIVPGISRKSKGQDLAIFRRHAANFRAGAAHSRCPARSFRRRLFEEKRAERVILRRRAWIAYQYLTGSAIRYFLTISATLKTIASSNSRRSRPVRRLIFSRRYTSVLRCTNSLREVSETFRLFSKKR